MQEWDNDDAGGQKEEDDNGNAAHWAKAVVVDLHD